MSEGKDSCTLPPPPGEDGKLYNGSSIHAWLEDSYSLVPTVTLLSSKTLFTHLTFSFHCQGARRVKTCMNTFS